ncbi:MAG TPA: tyrosine-type recombinase/integrase [Caldilineaceae bacterium]|nr:tyrosine-type recombinase/integrase [Caldilineaceae bacterium]
MILGRGTAQTADAIIAEYQAFLQTSDSQTTALTVRRLQGAPAVMTHRIGKPVTEWTDADLLALYPNRASTTCYSYSAFWAFLLFRGYRSATVTGLPQLPFHLTRHHRSALAPYRHRLEQAQAELQYVEATVTTELRHLIGLLAVVGKPLEEISRADFEAFRDEYQTWFRTTQRQAQGKPDSLLTRLEFYLIHWGVFPPAKVVFAHETHFAQLRHPAIRQAILAYMQWCDAKYKPSTIYSQRAALHTFSLWLQKTYPHSCGLDDVTRSIALAYAKYLQQQVDNQLYSPKYAIDLYRYLRLFYTFAIDERLTTSPDRNPFTHKDLGPEPDPVPRYLSDHEVCTILDYCNNHSTLKERTIITTLLHTGIRAAELAALQVTDMVQVQGKWKLHIHEGKGLKDRVVPLTPQCLAVLQAWQANGWERANDFLFTYHGRRWRGGSYICRVVRELGHKVGLHNITPHRFRHTFAVALLNYGMRESALQKLMGHATLNMTLEYARILDATVEQEFHHAVAQMATGARSWVPDFFHADDYPLFVEGDAISWIRLPHGYCRRNPKLHCESDVKCLLCDRYCASAVDLPRLEEMYERFVRLGLETKASVVASQIHRLQTAEKEIPLIAV